MAVEEVVVVARGDVVDLAVHKGTAVVVVAAAAMVAVDMRLAAGKCCQSRSLGLLADSC